MQYDEINETLKTVLKPSRYTHTLGVVQTATHLANIYGCNLEQTKLAALLHDCAKMLSTQEKISLCQKHHVTIRPVEYENPELLHAVCGAILAKETYGVNDFAILHAIKVHTTGEPAMNTLDKIIFVADYIEPGRDQAPNLAKLRTTVETDLDWTVWKILDDTVEYVRKTNPNGTDKKTYETLAFYEKLINSSEK